MKGENIQRIRKQRNLTQLQLSEKVGMDRSYLAQIESGKRKPSLATLERIAEQLNCSIKSFF